MRVARLDTKGASQHRVIKNSIGTFIVCRGRLLNSVQKAEVICFVLKKTKLMTRYYGAVSSSRRQRKDAKKRGETVVRVEIGVWVVVMAFQHSGSIQSPIDGLHVC